MMTASLRATATCARLLPRRFTTSSPQRFSQFQLCTRVSSAFAASNKSERTIVSPHLLTWPVLSISPDAYFRGVRPKYAPTKADFGKIAVDPQSRYKTPGP